MRWMPTPMELLLLLLLLLRLAGTRQLGVGVGVGVWEGPLAPRWGLESTPRMVVLSRVIVGVGGEVVGRLKRLGRVNLVPRWRVKAVGGRGRTIDVPAGLLLVPRGVRAVCGRGL